MQYLADLNDLLLLITATPYAGFARVEHNESWLYEMRLLYLSTVARHWDKNSWK